MRKYQNLVAAVGMCVLICCVWVISTEPVHKRGTIDNNMYSADSVDTIYYHQEDTTTILEAGR